MSPEYRQSSFQIPKYGHSDDVCRAERTILSLCLLFDPLSLAVKEGKKELDTTFIGCRSIFKIEAFDLLLMTLFSVLGMRDQKCLTHANFVG